MRALPLRDAADLLALVAELDALDTAEPFPPQLLGELRSLLRCGGASYCELDRARRVCLREVWSEDGDEGRMGETELPDDPYWMLRHLHPICGYRERAGDWTTTHMVTDFMSLRRFHNSEIWSELYREIPVNDWIDVGLRATGAHTRMFLFQRTSGGFGERDRLVLQLLQPHLQRRLDRVEAAAHASELLAALGDDPQHVVLCSRTGTIEFASRESRRLLVTHLDCENGHVPSSVLQTRAFATRERDGKRLTVRSAPVGDVIVVLLGEEDVRLDRLTPRQRAILAQLAQGKTDGQIATSLGIAAATVGKHLEQIYERLGVHTRTAAAALVR